VIKLAYIYFNKNTLLKKTIFYDELLKVVLFNQILDFFFLG